MSGSEEEPNRMELDALRIELGLPMISATSLPAITPPQGVTSISLNVDENEILVWVPPAAKHAYRRRFRELARREKRRAANAGNSANTSQIVGGSIGGALATGGLIALASASAPLALPAAIVATSVGAVIAAAGLMAGHWMNKKKFVHEERMERFLEITEELQ